MTTVIFSKNAVIQKRKKANKLGCEHFLIKVAEQSIIEHLELNNRTYNNAFIYGNLDIHNLKRFINRDIIQDNLSYEDEIKFDEKFDLIICFLNLHHINDVEGLILRMKEALSPQGLLIVTFFGGDTFTELRGPLANMDLQFFGGVSPRLLPKIDVKDAARLMQRAGLNNPIADVEDLTVQYSSIQNLLNDINALALGNVLEQRNNMYLGLDYFKKLEELLMEGKESFDLTYSLITASGVRGD